MDSLSSQILCQLFSLKVTDSELDANIHQLSRGKFIQINGNSY